MPTYSYRCPLCGEFALVRPMASASTVGRCPRCGRDGRRVYGAPALRVFDPGLRRALDAGERSADAPDVVRTVPGRSRQAFGRSTDPRHARLPRP